MALRRRLRCQERNLRRTGGSRTEAVALPHQPGAITRATAAQAAGVERGGASDRGGPGRGRHGAGSCRAWPLTGIPTENGGPPGRREERVMDEQSDGASGPAARKRPKIFGLVKPDLEVSIAEA